MLKSIVAIIVSYIAMLIVFMAIVTGLFFALGIERIFQPDSYEISTLWIVVTLILDLLVAIFGGYICAAIGKNWRTCQIFALIVFVLALIECFSDLRRNQDSPNVRAGEVGYTDAFRLAVVPFWIHFVNPIISGAGVLIGARMKRRDAA